VSSFLKSFFSLSILLISATASALPITYIYQGFDASGDLNGVSFINTDFSIVAQADTDNFKDWCCSEGQISHLSATIHIDGFDIVQLLTPSHIWYTGGSVVGFGKDLGANWMTFNHVDFIGYDLMSSIGPIFGNVVNVNQFHGVMTSAGILNFTNSELNASFEAVVSEVPEPAGLMLIITGLIGILIRSKRV
jgi:hypothetical protein